MARRRLGTVAQVRRYPVKSMRAESADNFALGWNGFEGDRQFAFCKADGVSRFPWFTGRDLAGLVLYRALYEHPDRPHGSPVQVRAPDGAEFDVTDPALAQRLEAEAGQPVRLLQSGRGLPDSMPVSVQTTAAARLLAQRHGALVGLDRFRNNVVIDTPEDDEHDGGDNASLLGRTLVFEGPDGTARLRTDRHIPRCRMVTLDPDTAAKDMTVLRTVVQQFDNLFGLYCSTVATGRIAVGDTVWVEGG